MADCTRIPLQNETIVVDIAGLRGLGACLVKVYGPTTVDDPGKSLKIMKTWGHLSEEEILRALEFLNKESVFFAVGQISGCMLVNIGSILVVQVQLDNHQKDHHLQNKKKLGGNATDLRYRKIQLFLVILSCVSN